MPFLSSIDDHETASITNKPKVDRRKQLKSLARISLAFVACVIALVCVFETWYIERMQSTTQRYNDNLDNAFAELEWNSLEIWDEQHQSLIKDALPVPVHSHNDYWQRIPLWEALGSGCISVEADIHLKHSDLLVGHNSHSLDKAKTLRSLYLNPLQKLIKAQNKETKRKEDWNGIFNKAPRQSIVLLIDLKTSEPETFAELNAQLQPLRDLNFLTYWNGTHRVSRPLTIVATGNTLFTSTLSLSSTHRDIFFDASLHSLASQNDDWTNESTPIFKYNVSNSFYASTPISNARVHGYEFPAGSDEQDEKNQHPQFKDVMGGQLEQAKVRGLVTRYWDVSKQKNKEESLWRWLMENEVGVLNMDDLGVVRDRARGWSSGMSKRG